MSRWRFLLAVGWRFLLSAALVAILIAAGLSVWATFDQRHDLEELVDAQRHEQATREERFANGLRQASDLLTDALQVHDEEMARQLTEALDRIAILLDRPAGTRPDPVTAQPTPPRAATTTSTTRPQPTTTTTTTRPCRLNVAGRCIGGPP